MPTTTTFDPRAAIAVDALEKHYQTQDGTSIAALGPLDLSVAEHEFVSVVGPSGCGKSTLLKIVAGLLPKSSGSARIFGAEVEAPPANVGIVFQSPVLLPWKTILENVLLPIRIRFRTTRGFDARAAELLEMVGLADFARSYPHELSGGMQQRAAIARSLIGNPDILLMDEPFGALDAITRDQMQVDLLSIWSASPKTALFITHSISEAVFLSDRVIVFGDRPGRIIEEFAIDLPRPRSVEQVALPSFGQLVADIRIALDRGIAGCKRGKRKGTS